MTASDSKKSFAVTPYIVDSQTVIILRDSSDINFEFLKTYMYMIPR